MVSKSIQNPMISHHFKCYNLSLCHYHFSLGLFHSLLNCIPSFHPCPYYQFFSEQPVTLFKYRQILSLLCSKLTNALSSHSLRWKPKPSRVSTLLCDQWPVTFGILLFYCLIIHATQAVLGSHQACSHPKAYVHLYCVAIRTCTSLLCLCNKLP